MRLEADLVAKEIQALYAACPEMADDEDLQRDMIEGETSAHEFLSWILREYFAAEGLAEGAGAAAKVLQARKARFDRRQEALKAMAKRIWLLTSPNKVKIERPEGTIAERKGSLSVHVTDIEFIPSDLITKEAKKGEIAKKLKAGEDVPGCELKRGDPSFVITAA